MLMKPWNLRGGEYLAEGAPCWEGVAGGDWMLCGDRDTCSQVSDG